MISAEEAKFLTKQGNAEKLKKFLITFEKELNAIKDDIAHTAQFGNNMLTFDVPQYSDREFVSFFKSLGYKVSIYDCFRHNDRMTISWED